MASAPQGPSNIVAAKRSYEGDTVNPKTQVAADKVDAIAKATFEQSAATQIPNTVTEEREAYIQFVIERKGVSREVAEAEVDAFY